MPSADCGTATPGSLYAECATAEWRAADLWAGGTVDVTALATGRRFDRFGEAVPDRRRRAGARAIYREGLDFSYGGADGGARILLPRHGIPPTNFEDVRGFRKACADFTGDPGAVAVCSGRRWLSAKQRFPTLAGNHKLSKGSQGGRRCAFLTRRCRV